MLNELDTEKVCELIMLAREFDVEVDEPQDEASNPSDDASVEVLTPEGEATVRGQFAGLISAMNTDELDELVALFWVGRGDFTADDWEAALAQSRDSRETSVAHYLLQTPLLADYLSDGLDAFDLSCEDFERKNQ